MMFVVKPTRNLKKVWQCEVKNVALYVIINNK